MEGPQLVEERGTGVADTHERRDVSVRGGFRETECYTTRGDAWKPTIKLGPSGKLQMHVDSSQIKELLNPVRGIRDAQRRMGIKPVNHCRINIAAVRESSKINSIKKATAEPPQPPPKRNPDTFRLAFELRPDVLSTSDTGHRDFVQENRVAAAASVRRGNNEDVQLAQARKSASLPRGRIPRYLLNRKMELAAEYEARMQAKEEAAVPPGMRWLPDDERFEMLKLLANNKADIEKQLQHLPILIETATLLRRKNDLELRLKEIEQATTIFERPRVLVQI